jgi:hypothetical protein
MFEDEKQLLYEIITTGENAEQNIKAVQQLGVSITNAVAKNGVNIIQLQNVVQNKVIKNAVKCLRLLDARKDEFSALPMERRLPIIIDNKNEEVLNPDEAFKNFIKADLNDGLTLEHFLNRVIKMFLSHALQMYGDEKIAAEKVGVPFETFARLHNEAK